MKKFTQHVLIVGAAQIAIMGAIGAVDLVGSAQADPAPCMTAAGVCDRTVGPHSHAVIVCQPTGPKAGAGCHDMTPHNA